MAYIPYFSDNEILKEWIRKTFDYYIAHVPSIYCNYYNLDKDASKLPKENQTLTDIHMNYHQLKYKLFQQQPLLLSDTSPSRLSSEGTIVSATNDPIQVTTITINPLLQPIVGDKIVIGINNVDLVNRQGTDVFTVEQVEFATQQHEPVNVVRLVIRRDLDFSNENDIPSSVLSSRYALILPYIGYIDFNNYTVYLSLINLVESIRDEIKGRYVKFVISNTNLNVEKQYIHNLRDILSQIVNYSPNIEYDGILRTILIPELIPSNKGITIPTNLRPMTQTEIINDRKYSPEIYSFDSFYTLDATGSINFNLLPEFNDFIQNSIIPNAQTLLAYSNQLQSLTTIELAQLVTLVDLLIRSWLI